MDRPRATVWLAQRKDELGEAEAILAKLERSN
jgi:hypothetical protein